jgi:hypothetical protein
VAAVAGAGVLALLLKAAEAVLGVVVKETLGCRCQRTRAMIPPISPMK